MADPALPLAAIAAGVALLWLCALGAAAFRARGLALVYPACIAAALLIGLADIAALVSGEAATASLPFGLPGIQLNFRLDALSAFFGLIVNTGIVAASLYGMGLDRRTELSGRVEPFFAAFAAAMNLVLVADDAFAFLFFWELMSVTSWVLVMARHEEAETRHAAFVYLVMAAIGTLALIFAFGGLAGPAGGYSFDTIRQAAPGGLTAALVLAAVLIGTGSKAGLVPLHAWLPLAHPAAPSHVSALMSGVMTKVAVYGMVRIVFDLMGPPEWWWSVPFIVLGACSAVLALLHAVLDNDLKRVLAFSTVENIGIIYAGAGLALAFLATGLQSAAAVAGTAALLHALFHSWFKSLLFLGAGAVVHATGWRDFDRLGGLIHRMPRTALFFLVGALAISALPPLNGFVSEWLLFQAVLSGPALPEPLLRFLMPVVGAMLALAAALAAAVFIRAFGIAFLGRPRSPQAAEAHEVPLVQSVAMGGLAALCVLGGLFGRPIILGMSHVTEFIAGRGFPGIDSGPAPLALVAFAENRSTYDGPIIAAFIAASAALTALIIHRVSNRQTRIAPAWDCGFPDPSPATQYTASSFAQPLRRVFATVALSAREHVDMPAPGEMRPASFAVSIADPLWQWLYAAPADTVERVSRRLNRLQFLTIRRYLVAMFAALIVLLLVTAVRG